jgi:hypothetical protein
VLGTVVVCLAVYAVLATLVGLVVTLAALGS